MPFEIGMLTFGELTEDPRTGELPSPRTRVRETIEQAQLADEVGLDLFAVGEHPALVLEHALRPLFGFFQALTIPVAVFASSGDFDGTTLLNPRVHGRIEMGLRDVTELLRSRATGAAQRTEVPGSL